MSKVRIVQLLCPERHCIIATYYESPDGEAIPEMTDRLREMFADFLKAGANPWCGICNSRNLHPEDAASIFATMAEAKPFIEKCALDQALTREYFKASKG
jgi:hypothetical protein